MDLTAGTRATAAAAAVVTAAGVAIILYGIIRDDLARSLGGACLTMTALTLLALIAIRRWVTDTRSERDRLADAQRQAADEQARYVAAQAVLEIERDRLRRDAAAEQRKVTEQLHDERAAMRDQFEEERAGLVVDTMETTVQLYRAGHFDPQKTAHAKIIDLVPHQETRQREPHAARDRGARRT